MLTVKPFSAVRPDISVADRVAALPYDVYSREEAYKKVQNDELSFLNIDRPETQFDPEEDMYAPKMYEKARDMIKERLSDGIFVREDKPCFYIYSLKMNGRVQTGFVACSSIDDYLCDRIKKHENTRADKELDRISHVNVCSAQTGPIFLAYRDSSEINLLIEKITAGEPLYDFTSEDGISHTVWKVDEDGMISAFSDAFSKLDESYIADGHHRAASAVKVGLMRRKQNPGYTGNEEFNYFLSVLFPESQLKIFDYNRVIKDLNGLSYEKLLIKLSEAGFILEPAPVSPYKPRSKGEFGLCLKDGYNSVMWFKLTAKPSLISNDPVEGLDVSILQDNVLSPLFGILDPKTDKRIDFVGGIRGLSELERRVLSDCEVAFSMYPTSMDELFKVADAGLLMPPKSTWFEPKLRSGLFIHEI